MQVILLEEMPNLGHIGDEVNVKPGYGRNYLLPRGIAVVASNKNKRELAHQKRLAAHKAAKARASAEAVAAKLNGFALTIARKVGEQDKLFGSVTTLDIEKALAAENVTVDRRKLHLPEPIKALGQYDVPLRLAGDVTATIKLSVVAEQ